MKKIICCLAIASMAFALSACTAAPAVPASTQKTDSTATVESGSAGSAESKPVDATGEQMVKGTITDAAMNSIMIKTGDGKELSFGTMDADKTACKGLTIDSKVTIYYTGTITDADTTKAVVTRMVQE